MKSLLIIVAPVCAVVVFEKGRTQPVYRSVGRFRTDAPLFTEVSS